MPVPPRYNLSNYVNATAPAFHGIAARPGCLFGAANLPRQENLGHRNLSSTGKPAEPKTHSTVHKPAPAICTPTPTQLLSHACQKRRFNPEWVERFKNGKYTCDVVLRGQVVRHTKGYDNMQAAKMAVAKKALPLVEASPIPPKGSANTTAQNVDIKLEESDSSGQAIHRLGQLTGMSGQSFRESGQGVRVSGSRDLVNSGPRRSDLTPAEYNLLEQVRKVMGTAMPDHLPDNPILSRAFLQGMALGSHVERSRQRTSRSRSPSAHPRVSGGYRMRSPLRGRIRTTPPPHYEHYPGRPHSDHYRPEDILGRDRQIAQAPGSEQWSHDGFARLYPQT
ncbi:hypothetical protein B0T17DRAFT_598455 [Bombardia bombarda]|uniref:Uncharacterized protein n=1 Tax=Bombardia bombarda TaxID=252184 RepID=A0AA39XA85_9PEZI|nr:hypothetical protein B0T17DRAFT_598455 [Bombardia bombarda]